MDFSVLEEYQLESLDLSDIDKNFLIFRIQSQAEFRLVKQVLNYVNINTRRYEGVHHYPHDSYCYYGTLEGHFRHYTRKQVDHRIELGHSVTLYTSIFSFLEERLICRINVCPKITLAS